MAKKKTEELVTPTVNTPSIEEYAQTLMKQQKLEEVYVADGFVFPLACDARLYVGKNGKYTTVKRAVDSTQAVEPEEPVEPKEPVEPEVPNSPIEPVTPESVVPIEPIK